MAGLFFMRYLLESLAKAAGFAKGVTQLVLLEPFAEVCGERALENLKKALFLDAPEEYLPFVIEATGDYASVV